MVNIKLDGKQKYLSKRVIRFVESKKFFDTEPFYVVLERLLGLRKANPGFFWGQIGDFTFLNSSEGGKNVKKKKRVK